jgi:hypothetical protein
MPNNTITDQFQTNAVFVPALIGRRFKRAPAKGSSGSLNLTTVAPRTAALLMAIVADELKLPLNELRFISIKNKGPAAASVK